MLKAKFASGKSLLPRNGLARIRHSFQLHSTTWLGRRAAREITQLFTLLQLPFAVLNCLFNTFSIQSAGKHVFRRDADVGSLRRSVR